MLVLGFERALHSTCTISGRLRLGVGGLVGSCTVCRYIPFVFATGIRYRVYSYFSFFCMLGKEDVKGLCVFYVNWWR